MNMFGERVRVLRDAQGWSQSELARRAGVSQPYVASLERGERSMPARQVRAVAEALGAPVSEMLALAAADRGLIERPPGLGDAEWADLVREVVERAEAARG